MTNPTPGERWEQGIDHDSRSEKIFHGIAKIDWEKNNDLMCFKHGGDGDNGETLMFLLDCYFAEEDAKKPKEVVDLTPFEALDRVKKIRAGHRACIGSLYKNVSVDVMQDFLEACIAKWGRKFMDCVERETDEELCGKEYIERHHGDKGKREVMFREGNA